MDLGFFRRAEQMLAARTAQRLDYPLLLALLHAQRQAVQVAPAATPGADILRRSLADVVLGAPAWRAASVALQGSFNPLCSGAGNAA